MEKERKTPQKDSFIKDLKFKEQLDKYLIHWKWIVFVIFVFMLSAFLTLRYATPKYEVNAIIKIQDEKGGNTSELAVFRDLGLNIGTQNNVENEIKVLKSKFLLTSVIKELGLNMKLSSEGSSLIKELSEFRLSKNPVPKDLYVDPPLKINFSEPDAFIHKLDTVFSVSIISSTEFILKNKDDDYVTKSSFGESIPTKFGNIIITPTFQEADPIIGSNITVEISSMKKLIDYYKKNLKIEPISEFSSVLDLSLVDGSKEKAIDILDYLVKKYNDQAIADKNRIAKNTSEFVEERLRIIGNELSDVDNTAEAFKKRYGVTDMASQTGLSLQSEKENEQKIVETTTQLQLIGYLIDNITNKKEFDLIPLTGVSDNAVSEITQKYNTLVLERKRLLKNSTDKHPIIINLNGQINSLKASLNQSLRNLKSSHQITLEALNKQEVTINKEIYSSPRKERQFRDIQRKQQIKEDLYLYLLQKREETTISLGVKEVNAKIIDPAISTLDPVEPKTQLVYLFAFLSGLFVPLGVIYLRDLLDVKIHSKRDLESRLNIPILGDIPKIENKKKALVSLNDHSSFAEAFRIIRTNLRFLVTNEKKKGQTIFVTSTISNEGKSLVSSNLASSLSFLDKKVLLMGFDIRAPKLDDYIGVKGKKGITNYIIDKELEVQDIILKVPNNENLNLISSGDIPPNPTKLLIDERVDELFEAVKKEYDYIIVDTAAANMVTDTLLISHHADAFIYVVRANYLDKRMLSVVESMHEEKKLPNILLLLNNVDYKTGYGYGYGYGLNFEKSKPWWRKKNNLKSNFVFLQSEISKQEKYHKGVNSKSTVYQ